MSADSKSYQRLLQSLLPKGKAWNRIEDSGLGEFLYGLAEEFARVDVRADDILIERDTRYTFELLTDHEIDFGLPDECTPEFQSVTERRYAINARLITYGRQNPQYYIDIALAYGWTITVTEYVPFWSGIGACGDSCGDQTNIFYWTITTYDNGTNLIYLECGDGACGDLLSTLLGYDDMTCILDKYKPAHTVLTWAYEGPAFDRGFSNGFDAIISSETSYLEGGFDRGFSNGFDVNFGGGFERDGFDEGFFRPE